jgi:cell division protein FtsW
MIAVALGIMAFVITATIPIKWWRYLKGPLIVLAAISAIAVRLFGQSVNGAYRWIQVGGFSFQSNELIKFALLIWLAVFLSEQIRDNKIHSGKNTLFPLLVALFIIGIVVAGLQSDLGSTGVMVAMMASMAFIAGLPLKKIMTIGGIIVIGVILAISASSYRRARLLTFLHPTSDCQSTGYQACQALIAIGSGGMVGLGLGRSVQATGYLPEAANDSIFAIYGEEFGLIGSLLLFGIFIALFIRLKNIVEKAPDDFSRLLVMGILVWLSTQTLINIGAMIGLLPLKGITLPFISYGGTSVLFLTAAIGLVFQISRYTTYRVPLLDNRTEGNSYENSNNRSGVRRAYNPSIGNR